MGLEQLIKTEPLTKKVTVHAQVVLEFEAEVPAGAATVDLSKAFESDTTAAVREYASQFTAEFVAVTTHAQVSVSNRAAPPAVAPKLSVIQGGTKLGVLGPYA